MSISSVPCELSGFVAVAVAVILTDLAQRLPGLKSTRGTVNGAVYVVNVCPLDFYPPTVSLMLVEIA